MALRATARTVLGLSLFLLLFWNSGTTQARQAAGTVRRGGEEEEASLADRSAQIIRQQDAEEGQVGMAAARTGVTVNVLSEAAAVDGRGNMDDALNQHTVHTDTTHDRSRVNIGLNTITDSENATAVCTLPPPPTNGHIERGDLDLVIGGKVKVRCEKGYTLIGPSVLTCNALPYPGVTHGFWQPQESYSCTPDKIFAESEDEPRLMPSEDEQNVRLGDSFCGAPPPPANGYIQGDNFDYGGKVYVHCEEGYALRGPSELTCGAIPCHMCSHGIWAPQDDYSCTPMPSPLETNMVDIQPLHTDEEDNPGPRYSVLSRARERSRSVQFEAAEEVDVNCPPPTPPAHGYIVGTDYSLYSRLIVECEPGYTLTGQSFIECLPVPDPFRRVGIWEPQDMATCKADPPSLLPLQLIDSSAKVRPPISNRLTDHVPRIRSRPIDNGPSSNHIEGLPSLCSLPKVVGPCKAAFPRYYFDRIQMECLPFTYGGCQGNDNNFETFKECQLACR